MPARTRKVKHSENDKGRIRASQLLNRLALHANNRVEMSATQVLAARVVIGKVIPDLKAIEVAGAGDKPLSHHVTVEFVKP